MKISLLRVLEETPREDLARRIAESSYFTGKKNLAQYNELDLNIQRVLKKQNE